MKITPAHLDHMQTAINKVLLDNPGIYKRYSVGDFARSDKVQDLQKRFCFDLAHMAGLTRFFCDVIYQYANDAHIYTALKAVCPKIAKQY